MPSLGDQAGEGMLLEAVVEVLGREPGHEARPDRRPVAVGDRVPGGVAVAPLDDHVVAEDALEGEAEAFGGTPRGGVQRIALPFQPTVRENAC